MNTIPTEILDDLTEAAIPENYVLPDIFDENHCAHGTYVGGCGIDWMCHPCEMGVSDADYARHLLEEAVESVRDATDLLVVSSLTGRKQEDARERLAATARHLHRTTEHLGLGRDY